MKLYPSIVVFFICKFCYGQTFKNCDIYQFDGNDSSKMFISLKQTFNSNGQILTETYQGYKIYSNELSISGTYFYNYKDNLLVKRLFVANNNDSNNTMYYYNMKKELIRLEQYDFNNKKRKNIDNEYYHQKGYLLDDAEFEKNKIWKKSSVINYSYNNLGKEILFDATEIHYSSQNKYSSSYDSIGRITKHCSYENERLIWVENYSYLKDTYKFTRIWYDYDGNPEKDKLPIFTFTYKLNKKSKVLEEKITTEKGELIRLVVFQYDQMDNIIKKTVFDSKGKKETTHIYIYY